MDRNDINTRLEDVVGTKDANNIMAQAEDTTTTYCMQHRIAPQTVEYLALLYRNVAGNLITYIEQHKK
jgi:hypothetical protein